MNPGRAQERGPDTERSTRLRLISRLRRPLNHGSDREAGLWRSEIATEGLQRLGQGHERLLEIITMGVSPGRRAAARSLLQAARRLLDSGAARGHGRHLVAALPEHVRHDHLVRGVVLDDQNLDPAPPAGRAMAARLARLLSSSEGWTAQTQQTLTPCVFIQSRASQVRAARAASACATQATLQRFHSIDSTIGYLLTREVTLRAAHTALRGLGRPATDHQLGLSVTWSRRW